MNKRNKRKEEIGILNVHLWCWSSFTWVSERLLCPCSVFLYPGFFFSFSLSVVHWSAGQACHISTLWFAVLLGSTVGWNVVAGAKFRRRSEGVPRLLVKQCHWDWHLERLWKICFFCFLGGFLHFFPIFTTTEHLRSKTSYFEYTDGRNGVQSASYRDEIILTTLWAMIFFKRFKSQGLQRFTSRPDVKCSDCIVSHD